MTQAVVIDTGPALNFIASGHDVILFDVLARRDKRLFVSETIEDEVKSKGERDRRFSKCSARLQRLLLEDQVERLQDELGSRALSDAVKIVCGEPLNIRMRTSQDLGETLVLAHALVLRSQGEQTTVLIDERPGTDRARALGIKVISTVGVLHSAAQLGIVGKLRHMRRIYNEIEAFDLSMGGWTSPKNPLNDSKLYGRSE